MSAGYLSGCVGKVRYETKQAALAARSAIAASGGTRMGQMRTYKCIQHGGWHNGHASGGGHRRVRGK